MCECGCSIFHPQSKLPAPNGEWYFIMVYPGCRDCDAPAGLDLQRLNRKRAAEWGINPDKVPDLDFHIDGQGMAIAAIPVLHPSILRRLMVPYFVTLKVDAKETLGKDGADIYLEEALNDAFAAAVAESSKGR